MQNLRIVAAALTTVALSAAAAPALAASTDQGAFTYRVSAAASNPHDPFRTMIKVPKTQIREALATKDCPCPMMQVGGAKPAQGAPGPHG